MAIGTLLIANRGEVGLRIWRTARRMGMRTVAIYSDADSGSPNVALADAAVRVGPSPAPQSYLNIQAVVEAARQEGADAVHPGYGFLAENAEFARACESAGLVFVGPSPEVIDLMGRKDQARQLARAAGAPVMAAIDVGEDGLDALSARVASQLGFPVLVKAVAGGGGKGMRVVRHADELGPALGSAAREAGSAFGDPSLFVERYLPTGRHLEVQLVGDGKGKVLHLWDRDCSVQRRYQKVVEEAPASVCSDLARAKALEAAVRIGAHVQYRNLGTVEFLARGDDVFFLEMNTRLQVEHTVTEEVTGLDLVELQLRLASGEPLVLEQDEVELRGHAIEARVYAEDPDHGFLPQAGKVTAINWPARARVETALEVGQEVGTFYDPMVAKVVAHGADREVARRLLTDALDNTALFGVTTNLGFLRRLVVSRDFARATIDTSWLDHHAGRFETDDGRLALVGAALYVSGQAIGEGDGPFVPDGWRQGGPPAAARLAFSPGAERQEVVVQGLVGSGGDSPVRVVTQGPQGGAVEVRALVVADGEVRAEVNGARERFFVHQVPGAVFVVHRGSSYRFDLARRGQTQTGQQANVVAAPLPGTLVSINVVPGGHVSQGQVLGVLESMKMEYALAAPLAATVRRVGAVAGARVDRGTVLFELEAEDA